jgi:ABC-2 type transport system permease protein
MTHSLHRSGTPESLRGDYVWFMYQSKGINDKNIAPKAMEFIAAAEAVGSENWGDVKSGSIAYLLGRPAHYVLYQFANSLGQILLNLFSFGILAVALGLIFVGPLPGFQPSSLLPLSLSFTLSIVLNFFSLMLIGLSSFVMEDNGALFFIFQKVNFMLGMFLPVEFLPSWLQPVAKNLPFSYIYWAPAKLFVDFSPELFWTLVPRQAMWAAVFVALVFFSYHKSVRRLQVNGG